METGSVTNGNGITRDIVAKLWNLCNVLRDDGITYTDYVTELTFLLFLKMLQETGHEDRLPKAYRWEKLQKAEGIDQLEYYRQMLLDLGNPQKEKDQLVLAIFTDAQSKLRKPTNLKALTDAIDKLDWFSAREEGLGNLYEGLLEKNANEKKSGAGQYFTPRPLIDCIVRLMKPQAGEVIQDPAAGTGGFLVAADRYIKDRTNDHYELTKAQAFFQEHDAFVGLELVPDTHRLCLMNLMLHGIECMVQNGDTLAPDGERLGKADLIMTNPPFGTKKGGGRPTRSDFSITADTSNKQLAFVEHIVRALKPGARAAVVVPDNVLFEDNAGRRLRAWMMELCDVHTILRLPIGIFYAQGVKTNVMFMVRGKNDKANTKGVWVYDMRANMDAFGKTRPLTKDDFKSFEKSFGNDPLGKAKRKDEGEESRFRIVATLDRLICRSKAARNELARIPGLVERYKQAVLKAAFCGDLTLDWRASHAKSAVDPLTLLTKLRSEHFSKDRIRQKPPVELEWRPSVELPDSWRWVSVDQLATIVQYGSSAKTSDCFLNGIPVLRMGNIVDGRLDYSKLKFLPSSHTEFPELLLADKDILFNRTNSAELVGKTAVYFDEGRPTSFASYLIRLRVVGYLPELLSAYINSEYGREWVRSVVNQQVEQANVNGTKLRELGVPLPPADEQRELWRRINTAFLSIDKVLAESDRATQLLNRLDRATLAKAFRGELVGWNKADLEGALSA